MSNLAKDWQEGGYNVYVKNGEVEVSAIRPVTKNYLSCVSNVHKRYVATARCASEDEFNLSTGVALAMDRLNKQLESANKEIKVGDRVLITDPTKAYTTDVEWVVEHIQDSFQVAMYRYNSLPNYNTVGKVIAVDNNKNEALAYIKEDWGYGIIQPGCWLMNTKGVRKL